MSKTIHFLVVDLVDGGWSHEGVLHVCYNLNKYIASVKLVVNFNKK